MSYVNSSLMAGEEIVFSAEIHPIIFLKSVLVFLFSFVFFAGGADTAPLGFVLLAVSAFLFINEFIFRISTEFAVTTKRVIAKIGFISRQTVEINLSKIEGLGIDQDILGRILGYGTVYVSGTGGANVPFKYIKDPMTLRKKVNEQMEVSA